MLLLSTSSLQWYGLHKIFQLVKKAGYSGIDLVIEHDAYDTWDKEYLKSLSLESGVAILSLTAPAQKLTEEKVNEIIEIARHIGAKVINFSPPHISDKNIKWFSGLLPNLKPEGIDITVQNVPPKFLFFIIPEYKNSTLDQIKKVTGNTSLDIAGIDSSSGMDITKASLILGTTLKNIYLSDKTSEKEGLMPGNAGGGISHLPIESFMMKLRSSWYEGYFSLKVDPLELSAGLDNTVIEKLLKLKEYYKKHFVNFKGE
jgi:sugar phosphate isomerase/epimerase